MKLDSDVKAVLERAVFTPDSLKIVEQLDRKLYVKVNKIVESVGGKWNKKRQVHIFTQDPRALFDLEAGKVIPEAMTAESITKAVDAGIQVSSAPQLFPTPPDICKYMVEQAKVQPDSDVLEPSAGTGNILRALRDSGVRAGQITAVEIHSGLAEQHCVPLAGLTESGMDFLTYEPGREFDRILMNPPFENGADIKHITHALSMLTPGGRCVAICAGGPRQEAAFFNHPWTVEWNPLAPGTFAGTQVRTAVITFERPVEFAMTLQRTAGAQGKLF